MTSFWSWFAVEFAPSVVVLTFGIGTLFVLAWYVFAWLAQQGDSFLPSITSWLPASVFVGAGIGVLLGGVITLACLLLYLSGLHPNIARFIDLGHETILALAGTIIMLCVLQFTTEIFTLETAGRNTVDDAFHRLGVIFGLLTGLFFFGISIIVMSISSDGFSGFQLYIILIGVVVAAGIIALIAYVLCRVIGWLPRFISRLIGNSVVLAIAALFSAFYAFSRAIGWVIGPFISKPEKRNPQLATRQVQSSKETRNEKLFIWIPVFSIIFGMVMLLHYVIIGVVILTIITPATLLIYFYMGKSHVEDQHT